MVTLMDLSLFQHLSSIFVFIMVFAVVYGFLLVGNFLKGKDGSRGIYALVAIAISFMIVGSKAAFALITVMTPWFTVLIIFIFLIFFVIRMFSGEDDSLFKTLIQNPTLYWVLIVIFVVIFIVSLSNVFGQSLLDEQVPSSNEDQMFESNTGSSTQTIITTEGTQPGVDGSTATEDFSTNMLMTIIHPKVLGMIALMLIGFFTIIFIAKTPEI